jgi:hypothetical protein
MSDFESLIREALSNGASYEDIASSFSDILNRVEEKDKANPAEELVDRYYDDFAIAYDTEVDFSFETIAKLIAAVAYNEHPDWSVEDVEECKNLVEHNIEYCIEMVGKSPFQGLKDVFSKVEEKLEDEDIVSDWLRILGL